MKEPSLELYQGIWFVEEYFALLLPEADPEPWQTFKMQLFIKRFIALISCSYTTAFKNSILNNWRSHQNVTNGTNGPIYIK